MFLLYPLIHMCVWVCVSNCVCAHACCCHQLLFCLHLSLLSLLCVVTCLTLWRDQMCDMFMPHTSVCLSIHMYINTHINMQSQFTAMKTRNILYGYAFGCSNGSSSASRRNKNNSTATWQPQKLIFLLYSALKKS